MKQVIKRYAKAFFLSGLCIAIMSGFLSWNFVYFPYAKDWLSLSSAIFFITGFFGPTGWEIQTYHGDTPAEKLNQYLCKLCNLAGNLLLVIAVFYR